jgi:HD-GYP domain-containing protein (c-di-GMP phosphodiesterase class II)
MVTAEAAVILRVFLRRRMVRYSIDDVTDEMVLGESIFLPAGDLLLAAGFRLTSHYRARLKQLGIYTVGIQIEGTESIKAEQIISEHIQREMVATINQTAHGIRNTLEIRKDGVQNVRRIIRNNREYLNRYLSSTGLAKTIETLVDQILNIPAVVLNMSTLKTVGGEELFAHVIGVAVTALCIGRKYHFAYEEMKQLAIGAINYDLGLVALPREIVEKTEELTEEEYEVFKQHTVYGYLMLSQNPSIAPTSSSIAIQHHENQNGTGYPRGLPGENRPPIRDFSRKKVIHRFAEIVAVADTYDCLINGRMGYRVHDVRAAIRKLISLSGEVLNSDIVRTMVSIVPIFPVGARIHVVNAPTAQLVGYYGVVARDNPISLEAPQIVLYETKNRQRIKPILIDLSLYRGFTLELVS